MRPRISTGWSAGLEAKLKALETVPIAVDPEMLQGMQESLSEPGRGRTRHQRNCERCWPIC